MVWESAWSHNSGLSASYSATREGERHLTAIPATALLSLRALRTGGNAQYVSDRNYDDISFPLYSVRRFVTRSVRIARTAAGIVANSAVARSTKERGRFLLTLCANGLTLWANSSRTSAPGSH
jgi:hypothetical protein